MMKDATPRNSLKALCSRNKLVINGLAYALIILFASGTFSEPASYAARMSVVILALGAGFLASWVQVKYPSKSCAK